MKGAGTNTTVSTSQVVKGLCEVGTERSEAVKSVKSTDCVVFIVLNEKETEAHHIHCIISFHIHACLSSLNQISGMTLYHIIPKQIHMFSHHYRELRVHSSKVKKQINGDESRTITHEQTSKIITHPNGKKINESRENGKRRCMVRG